MHKNSNHAKAFLTASPKSLAKTPSNLPSTKLVFEKTTEIYSEGLKKVDLRNI